VTVLAVGLDAFPLELLEDLAARGEIPTLARIMRNGVRGDLEHEYGYFVGSTWPTMMSGRRVTEHGWYSGTRFRAEDYAYEVLPLAVDPFWRWVDDHGIRSVVVDVPHFPVTPIDGVHLIEWGCHDRFFGPSSWPNGFLVEVHERYGTHPIGELPVHDDARFAPCDHVQQSTPMTGIDLLLAPMTRSPEQLRALFDDLLRGVELRTTLLIDAIRERRPGLVMAVFGEAHCAGHQLWHLHDHQHPSHDADVVRAVGGDPMVTMARALDRAMERVIEALDEPDPTVYLLVSHGMRAKYHANAVLPAILERLADEFARSGPFTSRFGRRSVVGAAKVIVASASPTLRRRIVTTPGIRGIDTPLPLLVQSAADRAASPWFALDNNTVCGAVRLNVRGRERDGSVEVDDIDVVLGWLASELASLVNVDTGERLVRSIQVSSDVHDHGVHHDLADLLIDWNPSAPIDHIWSPSLGHLGVTVPGTRSGDHEPYGAVFGLLPGRPRRRLRMDPASVGPTLAASVGAEVPNGVAAPTTAMLPARGRSTALVRATDDLPVDQPNADRDLEVVLAIAAQREMLRGWVPTRRSVISVIIPTFDRADQVMIAARSVLDQTIADVEVIVVDDGSTDGTVDRLAGMEDPRLMVLRSTGRCGPAAARNLGIAQASGEIVTYLDSDNVMHSDWCRSLAWAFEHHPSVHWLYGARVIDDRDRHFRTGEAGLPWIQLLPWDRNAMRTANRVDMNVIAHRRNDVRFDEQLMSFQDWDFAMSLAETGDPLRFASIAAWYTTGAPDRMSRVAAYDVEIELLRHRFARRAQGHGSDG
jgi:hypothetical protein